MSTQTDTTRRLSVDEWLAPASPRVELVNGVEDATRTYTTADIQSTSIQHATAVLNVALALSRALQRAESDFRVLTEGPVVRTAEQTARIPDISVCAGVDDPNRMINELVIEPVMVAEIMSPATSHVDRVLKLEEYMSTAFILDYLVVRPDQKQVMHASRPDNATEKLSVRTLSSKQDVIIIGSLNITISLWELFN